MNTKGNGKRWTGREEGAGGRAAVQAQRNLSGTHAALKRQFSRQVAVRHLNCEECVYTQLHTAYNGYHSFSASGA